MQEPTARKHLFFVILLTFLTTVIGIHPANATLLLHEPFNYGANNTTLISVSGPALGLDGTNYTGYTASTYVAAGLTFGNLIASGGNSFITYSGNAQANTRGLDFNVAAGSTLYGGFLHAASSGQQNSTGALLFGSETSTDQSANLAIITCWYGTTCQYTGLSAYNSPTSDPTRYIQSTGVALALNTPVLILFRVTNMGASSGTQTASLWVLNEAQFAYHRAGGLTPSVLDAAGTGTGASQILQKAQLTISRAPYVTMTDAMFMRPYIFRCAFSFDELRLSTTSLDKVAPGPPRSTLISVR